MRVSGFPLAVRRHPLTRVQVVVVDVRTGSRTHPRLYSGIPCGIQPKTFTRTKLTKPS
jgi:hypothetical protein